MVDYTFKQNDGREAMQGLGQTLDTMYTRSRQAKLDDMARHDWEARKAERDRLIKNRDESIALETQLGLGKTVATHNPAYELTALETANNPPDVADPGPGAEAYNRYQQGLRPTEAMLSSMVDPTVPKELISQQPYSTRELADARSKMLASQGDQAGALAAAKGTYEQGGLSLQDTQNKLRKLTANSMNYAMMGASAEQTKAKILEDAAASGATPEEMEMLKSFDFTGGVVSKKLPDGGMVILKPSADGAVVPEYHAAIKPEKTVETWSEPYVMEIGGKKAMVQKSSHGNIKPVIQDTSTNVKMNTGTPRERTLSSVDVEKLEERRNSKDLLGTLNILYKPDFRPVGAKYTLSNTVGELEVKIEQAVGNNPEASAWWQQYFEWANKELKKQSGAAVTEPEYRRFLQESIGTSGDPKLVQDFLDRREKRATANYNQMADGLGVGRERAVSTYRESGETKTETRQYQGKTYELIPGKDRTKKESWKVK